MTADLTFEGSRGHYLGSRTINLLNGRFHASDFYSFISELFFSLGIGTFNEIYLCLLCVRVCAVVLCEYLS